MTNQPHNTQELDEILEQAFLDGASDTMWQNDRHVEIFATAKQAILNWHNKQVKNAVATAEDNLDQYWNKELDKQVEELLDRLESERDSHNADTGCSDELGYIPLSAIAAERAKRLGRARHHN